MFHRLPGRVHLAHRQSWLRVPFFTAMLLIVGWFLFGSSGATLASAATHDVNWPKIRLQLIAGGFDDPIDVVSPNDGTNRLFVVERGGMIHVIENGVRLEEPFLNIKNKVLTNPNERGLLGLAFPPDFAEEGYFFINYTSNTNLVNADPWDNENNNDENTGDTVIARLHLTGDPNIADSDSEESILVINQPAGNHNGGHILFGPDGYLYIGMGDGGGGGDVYANAQDPRSLLGKMLRIEVGPTGDYSSPPDNPFIDTADYRDEIWAEGLRNPWRFGFDPISGDFYLADVGQGAIEEVNYIAADEIGNGGMNFGWPIMEGDVCYPPNGPQDCDRAGLVAPIATYNHDLGDCSVTGGHVYRSNLPDLAPVYLYADYCTGRLWGAQLDGDEWVSQLLEDFPFQITSFGEDENGNIYIVNYAGEIYQIVPALPELTASIHTNRAQAIVGDTITYTYLITNTSQITLTVANGQDSRLGEVAELKGELAPNATRSATRVYTVAEEDPLGSLTNTISLGGTDALGRAFTTNASTSVAIVAPVPSFPVKTHLPSIHPPNIAGD